MVISCLILVTVAATDAGWSRRSSPGTTQLAVVLEGIQAHVHARGLGVTVRLFLAINCSSVRRSWFPAVSSDG
jgi:hypothetical protein